jgi:hypothetical protein
MVAGDRIHPLNLLGAVKNDLAGFGLGSEKLVFSELRAASFQNNGRTGPNGCKSRQ